MFDLQLSGAHFRGASLPSAEECQPQPCKLEQADAKAIADIKTFLEFSLRVQPQPSVGEDAVNIEHQKFNFVELAPEEVTPPTVQWVFHANPA